MKFEIWYKKSIAIRAKQMKKPFNVKTLEGIMHGKAKDYLIIGIKGERYPIDKTIFEQSYSKEQSVPKGKIKKAIEKEWKNHRKNYSNDGEWFECNAVETDVYFNYGVGAEIITTYFNGKEKRIVLKTKKEADEYSKKQKKKWGKCPVCDRFEFLLKQLCGDGK